MDHKPAVGLFQQRYIRVYLVSKRFFLNMVDFGTQCNSILWITRWDGDFGDLTQFEVDVRLRSLPLGSLRLKRFKVTCRGRAAGPISARTGVVYGAARS
jgi:hypothetical protein